MNSRIVSATALFTAAVLLGCEKPPAAVPAVSDAASSAFVSGPQVGSSSISPFDPLHVTGPGAGGKSCLV
jgi:hypothetical protein